MIELNDTVALRRFRFLWGHRHSSPQALVEVKRVLAHTALGPLARSWIAEGEARRDESERREMEAVETLRASLRGVSLLLVRACEDVGLSLAAVAYGVLPSAHLPEPTEGFPWEPAEGTTGLEVAMSSATTRWRNGWERRHYRDGAFVRHRVHPAGRWAVRQQGGVLHTSLAIGGCLVRSRGECALIDVPDTLPEMTLIVLKGLRLSSVIDHPLFDDDAFVITSAAAMAKGARIVFSAPVLPLRFDELRQEPGRQHHQLGRDGSLSGNAAVEDVIRRGIRLCDSKRENTWANLFDESQAKEADRERIRRINLMAPPWCETLPLPD